MYIFYFSYNVTKSYIFCNIVKLNTDKIFYEKCLFSIAKNDIIKGDINIIINEKYIQQKDRYPLCDYINGIIINDILLVDSMLISYKNIKFPDFFVYYLI